MCGWARIAVSTVKDIIYSRLDLDCSWLVYRGDLEHNFPIRGRKAEWHVFLQLLMTFIYTNIHMYIINN